MTEAAEALIVLARPDFRVPTAFLAAAASMPVVFSCASFTSWHPVLSRARTLGYWCRANSAMEGGDGGSRVLLDEEGEARELGGVESALSLIASATSLGCIMRLVASFQMTQWILWATCSAVWTRRAMRKDRDPGDDVAEASSSRSLSSESEEEEEIVAAAAAAAAAAAGRRSGVLNAGSSSSGTDFVERGVEGGSASAAAEEDKDKGEEEEEEVGEKDEEDEDGVATLGEDGAAMDASLPSPA